MASLLPAALDLQMVRLIRGAMAGPAGGCGAKGPLGTIRCDQFEPRPRIQPEPRFEPRPVVHPAPRFQPRPQVQPLPRVADRPITTPVEPEQPTRTSSPLKAPWQIQHCQQPIQPAPVIKVEQIRPDIVNKGSLIDFYL